jgi:hypothetical protein
VTPAPTLNPIVAPGPAVVEQRSLAQGKKRKVVEDSPPKPGAVPEHAAPALKKAKSTGDGEFFLHI